MVLNFSFFPSYLFFKQGRHDHRTGAVFFHFAQYWRFVPDRCWPIQQSVNSGPTHILGMYVHICNFMPVVRSRWLFGGQFFIILPFEIHQFLRLFDQFFGGLDA